MRRPSANTLAMLVVLIVAAGATAFFLWVWRSAPDPAPVRPATGNVTPGIDGVVLERSDVVTIPEAPIEALVVAFPDGRFGELLDELGLVESGAPEALSFTLDLGQVASFGGTAVTSTAEGAYHLNLTPGAHAVCLGNVDQEPTAFPARLRGCARGVAVPTDRRVALDLGLGEAGLSLR